MIDIIEQRIADLDIELLKTLLKDRTTKENIRWATDNYISRGEAYYPEAPITVELVTGENTRVVQPRVAKSIEEQTKRTKDNAEVFTPSWICNEQNNLIDGAWFGRDGVFNTAGDKSWTASEDKIEFPSGKTWKNYVDDRRLEITCGEAPYLASRYDTVTGGEIPVNQRIGMLDRKLRVINENVDDETEWMKWTMRAFQSTYGYEYQGDNVLLARENLLITFIDNMRYKFSHDPDIKQLRKIAHIISWNIWQMDGLTMNVPFAERPSENKQMVMGALMDLDYDWGIEETEPIPCKIFDWRANNSLEFRSMLKGGY